METLPAGWNPRSRSLFVTLVACLGISAIAWTSAQPKSFALEPGSQTQVEVKTLPPLDTNRLLAEDRDRPKDSPLRVAVAVHVDFTPQNSGTWLTQPDDSRIWRLCIHSPGAGSLSLGLSRFDLPEGAKLWLYNPSHDEVQGPYTSRNRSPAGTLFTPIIRSDQMFVELDLPAGSPKPAIDIATVNQGYRGFGTH